MKQHWMMTLNSQEKLSEKINGEKRNKRKESQNKIEIKFKKIK